MPVFFSDDLVGRRRCLVCLYEPFGGASRAEPNRTLGLEVHLLQDALLVHGCHRHAHPRPLRHASLASCEVAEVQLLKIKADEGNAPGVTLTLD